MTTDTSAEALERKRFEEWYATHAHNYARDPVGSRDCGLQWDAWKAALAAEKRRAREGVMDESKTRAWNEYYSNAVSRLTSIHELDVYWALRADGTQPSKPSGRMGGMRSQNAIMCGEHCQRQRTVTCVAFAMKPDEGHRP